MAEHWSRLVKGYSLNELGRQQFKKLASRYEASEIMDGMVVATDQYLKHGVPAVEVVPSEYGRH